MWRYEEEKLIFSMLFKIGLGETFKDFPYETAYEQELAITRIKKFLDLHGISEKTQNDILMVLEVVVLSNKSKMLTIEDVYRQQVELDEEFQKKKSNRVTIENDEDLIKNNLTCAEEVFIRSCYSGKLTSLEFCLNLRRLNCFYPLEWKVYQEVDMSNIQELYITIYDLKEGEKIRLNAPNLESLTISIHNNGYEKLTEIEKRLFNERIIDFSNLTNIKELKIFNASGYNISSIKCLENLKVLHIRQTELDEFVWLKDCQELLCLLIEGTEVVDISNIPELIKLKELMLYTCDIRSIDNIELYPELELLDLSYNKIQNIEVTDNIKHVKRLVLYRNPICNNNLDYLGVDELILSDIDKRIYSFDNVMNDVFKHAYMQCKCDYEHINEKAPFFRQRLTKMTKEQRFEELLLCLFNKTFNDLSQTICIEEYNPIIKKKFIDFVIRKYPFIKITDEMYMQLQQEFTNL